MVRKTSASASHLNNKNPVPNRPEIRQRKQKKESRKHVVYTATRNKHEGIPQTLKVTSHYRSSRLRMKEKN